MAILMVVGVKGGGGFLRLVVLYSLSKIALGDMVWMFIRWLLTVNFGVIVESLNCVPVGSFLCCCNACIVLCLVLKECAFSLRCFAKLDVWLLFRKTRLFHRHWHHTTDIP
jgi:hypothetical protein